MMRIFQGLLVASLVTTVQVASAATLTTPNVFVADTPALASEVNANFTAVKTAVDGNDTAIGANTTAIGTNTTAIGANATATGTNATDIGTNTTAIGANTTATGTNATAIGANTTATGTNTTAIASIESRLAALEGATGGVTPVSLASIAGSWGMIYNRSYTVDQNSNFVEVGHETLYGVVSLTAGGTFSFSITGGKDAITGLTSTSRQFTDPNNGAVSTVFDQGSQLTDTVATAGVAAAGTVTLGQGNAITLELLDPVTNASQGLVDGFVSQNGQMIVLEGHDEPNASMVWTLIKTQ